MVKENETTRHGIDEDVSTSGKVFYASGCRFFIVDLEDDVIDIGVAVIKDMDGLDVIDIGYGLFSN